MTLTSIYGGVDARSTATQTKLAPTAKPVCNSRMTAAAVAAEGAPDDGEVADERSAVV